MMMGAGTTADRYPSLIRGLGRVVSDGGESGRRSLEVQLRCI
jgi:hypothetical protein